MRLPAGWKAYSKEKNYFHDPARGNESYGWVGEYLLKGRSLTEFVEASLTDVNRMKSLREQIERRLGAFNSQEEGSSPPLPRICSGTQRKVSGLEAIEVVCEAEYSVLELYIRKGDKVINVAFRTLKGDFPQYEASFRQAIDSITIR